METETRKNVEATNRAYDSSKWLVLSSKSYIFTYSQKGDMIVHVGGKDSSSAVKPYEVWERDEQNKSFTIRQTDTTLSNWRNSVVFFVDPDEFNIQP